MIVYNLQKHCSIEEKNLSHSDPPGIFSYCMIWSMAFGLLMKTTDYFPILTKVTVACKIYSSYIPKDNLLGWII